MPAMVAALEDTSAEIGASFLVRLRSETRALHASTERRIAPAEHLRNVQAYARLLSSLYPLYASIEDQVAAFAEWRALSPPLNVAARRRASLLATDLCRLGGSAPRGEGPVLPDLASFASAFGALYVVEGSRLGGRLLARQVATAIGHPAAKALCFLRSDGTDVGRLWTELRCALAGYAAGSNVGTCDAIVAGALDTFRCFDRQLALWEP